jgi:hypothetical protein
MTEIDEQADQRVEQQTAEVEVSADHQPTVPEVPEWRRDDVFLPEASTEQFPSLRNISAGSSSAVQSARSNRLHRST